MSRNPDLANLLSEAELRRLAGPVSFERGEDYFLGGAVTSVRVSRGRLMASVEGTHSYSVHIWIHGRNLDWSCTCPLVAAGLAWLADGKPAAESLDEDQPPAVEAYLDGLSREALVRLVLERANEDETLAAWLLVKAQSKGIRSPKAALRTIERAFRLDGDFDYSDTPKPGRTGRAGRRPSRSDAGGPRLERRRRSQRICVAAGLCRHRSPRRLRRRVRDDA